MKHVAWSLISALFMPVVVHATDLKPAEHADFPRYTYALTWQPGFCSTEEGCLPKQSHDVLIGLHGLWASEPQSLIDQKVPVQQWWAKGCAFYSQVSTEPTVSPMTQDELTAVMPQLKSDLERHEYTKHVECFGFPVQQFFDTELRMRQSVSDSGFGAYLTQRAGQMLTREDVQEAFIKAFGTDQRLSLQLQCGKDKQGRIVLTQFWFTLQADKLAAFPDAQSFVTTPASEYEDNCSQPFFLPSWPKA